MQLIILSGLSGAGKRRGPAHARGTWAITASTLFRPRSSRPSSPHTVRSGEEVYERTAIGLDARNTDAEIASVPTLVDELRRSGIECEILFLVAAEEEPAAAASPRPAAPTP